MLQTIDTSRNSKTGNIAQTYRSGIGSMFAGCPSNCDLNPRPEESTNRIDRPYLRALLRAVPADGQAFGYSHFPWRLWAKDAAAARAEGPTTTLNYSADTRAKARQAVRAGIPCVIAIPEDEARRVERVDGIRYVQCPATYLETVSCETCGGGRPLCARADRDYVISFPAHGATKKRVGTNTKGGCYAAGGNVAFHWRKLAEKARTMATRDAEKLTAWARTLPAGKILRHHVAGDIGKVGA